MPAPRDVTCPRTLTGRIRCTACRQAWGTTWNTQAPVIICHECGGPCVPEGPQVATHTLPDLIEGELFRLERYAVSRCQS